MTPFEAGLAFLTAVPAVSTEQGSKTEPSLPVFKPRFWYRRDRLDARPVAWSLRNRPDDWEWADLGNYVIRHKPSSHEFWVATWGCFRLYRADCSCSSTDGHFQRHQQWLFGRAYLAWRRNRLAQEYDPQEFADHFVR